jgi:hypothetical protein
MKNKWNIIQKQRVSGSLAKLVYWQIRAMERKLSSNLHVKRTHMRIIILAFLSVIQMLCNGQSKDGMTFKVQYNPETKYNQTIEQTSYNEVRYSGSDAFLKQLKDNGIQNPTITSKKSTTETLLKT